uniref:Uncharacterized protein n=1 Tax=Halalkalibacterium halodurans TaxID=86665 RepID=A0A0M0KIP2_ALKHA
MAVSTHTQKNHCQGCWRNLCRCTVPLRRDLAAVPDNNPVAANTGGSNGAGRALAGVSAGSAQKKPDLVGLFGVPLNLLYEHTFCKSTSFLNYLRERGYQMSKGTPLK